MRKGCGKLFGIFGAVLLVSGLFFPLIPAPAPGRCPGRWGAIGEIRSSDSALDTVGKEVYWETFDSMANGFWSLSNATIAGCGFGTNIGLVVGSGLAIHGGGNAVLNVSRSPYDGLFAMDFSLRDDDSDIRVEGLDADANVLWYVEFSGTQDGYWSMSFDARDDAFMSWPGELVSDDPGRVGFWFNLQLVFTGGVTEVLIDGLLNLSRQSSPAINLVTITSLDSVQGNSTFIDNVIVGTISGPVNEPGGGDTLVIENMIIKGAAYIDTVKFFVTLNLYTAVGVKNYSTVEIRNCMVFSDRQGSRFGVYLKDVDNVVIEDCYFRFGESSVYINGNAISNDSVSVENCVFGPTYSNMNVFGYFQGCDSVFISGNHFINAAWLSVGGFDLDCTPMVGGGINLASVLGATIINNTFMQCGLSIQSVGTNLDIDSSAYTVTENTVNGKSLYFAASENSLSINSSAGDLGQIVLLNCTGFSITDIELSGGQIPLSIICCSGGIVSGVNISWAFLDGISTNFCHNITIENCVIDYILRSCILLGGGTGYTIARNTLTHVARALRVFLTDVNSTPSYIEFNTIKEPHYVPDSYGMDIQAGCNLVIRGNDIEGFETGISIDHYAWEPTFKAKQIRIHDNCIQGTGTKIGVDIVDGYDIAIERNEISNFSLGIGGWSYDDENLTLVPNLISANSVHDNGDNSNDEAASNSSVFAYLTFPSIDVETIMANQPVRVILPGFFNYSKTADHGADIRFYNVQSTSLASSTIEELHYWIEDWNESGDSAVWVKIPDIGMTRIVMWSGEPTAESESNASNTFLVLEDYESYTIGEIPLENHGILFNSTGSNYTVADYPVENKVGYFNDVDSLTVLIDVARDVQAGDTISWKVNFQEIENGKSAIMCMCTGAMQAPFVITAFEGGVSRFFFILDGDGVMQIQSYTLDTWYTFAINFNGNGTYDLFIDWICVAAGRQLEDVGTDLKYLVFLDVDGGSNFRAFVDDIIATWPVESVNPDVYSEGYSSYADGEVPGGKHVIINNSTGATFTALDIYDKMVGCFNDTDDMTALAAGVDIEHEIQAGDLITWRVSFQEIADGKTAIMGLFTCTFESLLLVMAFESADEQVHTFYIWDGDGITEIQSYNLDTWYTFTILMNGDGSYNLYVDGSVVALDRALQDVGSTVKYLGFVDADGYSNWQGYIDNIATIW